MSLPQSIRGFVALVIGLVVGGVGATLFIQSMPGREGSAEERANKLELELKRARSRIAALEAEELPGTTASGIRQRRGQPRDTLADGARRIAEDVREGRPVNPEDIFRASKPLLRDLAPLFDRIRVRQEQQVIDTLAGEVSRRYDLTPEHQASLKKWFEEKSKQEAKRWSELVAHDHTRLEDLVRASQDVRPDEGLDHFMEGILTGDKLAAFKADRMADRAERVQREADMKVQRLDSIVRLDEKQRDQVFGAVARTSRDYDPAMRLEGVGGEIGTTAGLSRQDAMLAVLRPEQRAAYEAERQRRREEAAKDLEAIGLTLPDDWEMFDESDFK